MKKDTNREYGYLTTDEFLALYTPGLREYMHSVWPSDKDETHHPEDLASHAAVFAESALRIIGSFGINPARVKDLDKD